MRKMNVRTIGKWVAVLTMLVWSLGLQAWAGEVKVFAAASLTDALKALQKGCETSTGDQLVFNFAGSNTLARQIGEGAPADLFLSADTIQMVKLSKSGLLAKGSLKDVLSNRLVVIVPSDVSRADFTSLAEIASSDLKRLALADPMAGVPAGVYAKACLKKAGLWGKVIDRVVPTADVRAALAAVEYGNVDAGIVYKTDASISRKVRVVFEVPTDQAPRIVYPFAATASSKDPEAARRVLEYLEGPDGMKVFERFGFLTAEGK